MVGRVRYAVVDGGQAEGTLSGWVPAGGVLLHIGPHKTGTTALQSALSGRRAVLAHHGVHYAGATEAPHGAVRARLGTAGGWNDEVPPGSRRMWRRLCEQTAERQGTVVLSSEALCHALPRQIPGVCSEIAGDRPVRVLITVRPLARVVPSSWQEYLKSGWTTSYEDFLAAVVAGRDHEGSPTPTFWIRQDHARHARRWARVVGADNVLVVVVDPARPEQLIGTVEEALGLPGGLLPRSGLATNRSLTAAECEFVRRINEMVGRSISWDTYNTVLRRRGLHAVVETVTPPPDAARLGVPTSVVEPLLAAGDAAVQGISRLGVRVRGDLGSLAVVPASAIVEHTVPTVVPVASVEALLAAVEGTERRAPMAIADTMEIDDAAKRVYEALLAAHAAR